MSQRADARCQQVKRARGVSRLRFGADCNHTVDGSFQVFHLHRLHQMLGESRLEALVNISVHAESADGDAGHSGYRTEISHQFDAGPVWQRDVTDEEIE